MQKRKTFVSIICVILAIAFVASLLFAAIGSASAVTQSEIDALKNKQAGVQQQQQELQSKIGNIQGEMDTAVAKKTALDEQNELARQEIELINEQIDLYDKLIEKKAKELEEAKAKEEEQKEKLRVRMRAMEESGSATYLSILFKADDFSDLLARINDISKIMEYNEQLKDDYVAARENVEKVKAEYEATQEEQKETRTELEDKKAQLETQIANATKVITDLNNDIENAKMEFQAFEAAEASLQSQIDQKVAALEEQQRLAEEQAKENGTTAPSIPQGSGQFIWPTPSCPKSNITCPYGWRNHPIYGTRSFHTGTDIGASSGSQIVAADSGTVILACYNGSYGNCVVISHGNGISTLYAHMNRIAVSNGQAVSQGETIGYVGTTGCSTGPHLHFEVKVNGSTTNPMNYF